MIESQDKEFKEKWKDEYLKTLCAFANGNGGILYIGVRDDGMAIGLKNIKKILETLPNKIRNNLGIISDIQVETWENKKEIIKVKIRSSEIPVFYKGKYYVRSGSTTQEVNGYDLMKVIMKKYQVSWDSLPSEAGIEELDDTTIDKFKNMAMQRLTISKKDTSKKLLENLELIKNGKLTNAALLLFGKNPQKYFFNTVSRVGRFKNQIEIVDTVIIKGNLFQQVESIINAIKKHINVKYVIENTYRKDVWDYPLPAIREACINSLIHRDYMDSAEIQIKIYDDHIWFWNPGSLPKGIAIDDLKKDHTSKPRNKLLAMIFYYAGLIEKWGTGTKRIVELCKEQGLPEPKFKEEFGGFSVILQNDIYNEESLKNLGLNDRQIKAVLYAKKHKKITVSEFKKLVVEVSKKTLYRDLQKLVKIGILKAEGEKRGKKYVL